MPLALRGLILWLLAPAWPLAAQAADAARCSATLSPDERNHLEACIARGTQCTDYWPGYPDDLRDCPRAQKWLAKAIAMPESMRLEIFGPMPDQASASGQAQPAATAPVQVQSQPAALAPAAEQAATPGSEQASASKQQGLPAWKNLPRSQDGSAPRPVATGVAGATSANYSGASSKLDPDQARKAGLGFWTGQVVQIADTVTVADRMPAGEAPRPVSAPAPAPVPAPVPGGAGTSSAPRRELPVNYTNHPNATNECVELRGNTIGNKCNFDLLVTWCVSQPQQTKNFFDSSEAFECGKGGALNTIKAGSVEGNVLYGYIIYYACPYTDYYTPARMKTSFGFEGGLGLYRGTCGDGDRLSNNWTIGGTLVSRPRQ